MAEKYNLLIELPPVEEEPRVTLVRCGESEVEVSEYGTAGSGRWTAWTPGRTSVINYGGKEGYTYLKAVEDAHQYVVREERRRRSHEALRAALSEVEQGE